MIKEKYCPFCGLKLTNGGIHIYTCKKRDFNLTKEQIRLKFLEYNFGENILENICNDYLNLYSLPMLNKKYNGIDNKSIYFLLSLKNIHIRNISESAIKISQEKMKKTLQKKYGKNIINPGQIPEVKEKVKQTFLEHYGVDNIWKLQDYNKKCAELHPETHKDHMEKLYNGRNKAINENKFFDSKLEKRICNIFNDLNLSFIRQFHFSNYKHPYDFKLLNTHIIIEINGDFWHCNPNIYNENYYHKIKHKTAKEIWEDDKKHIEIANKHNHKVIEIWESDMSSMNDIELTNYIKELLNNI